MCKKFTAGKLAETDKNVVKQSITRKCIHSADGAIEVAKYICNEIIVNTKSRHVATMFYYNDYIGRMKEWQDLPWYSRLGEPPEPMLGSALVYWTTQVRQDGPWDHKPIIRKKFQNIAIERPLKSGRVSESHYHKYKDYDLFYDLWSNIHYGYVGMASGFTESLLLDGAGLEQIATDFLDGKNRSVEQRGNTGKLRDYDNVEDRECITLGIKLYKKYKTKNVGDLSYQNILDGLVAIHSLDGSRLHHVCFDKSTAKYTEK